MDPNEAREWIGVFKDVFSYMEGSGMTGFLGGLLVGGGSMLFICLVVIYRDAVWRFLRRREKYQDRD